jgi:rhomboid protease GluP
MIKTRIKYNAPVSITLILLAFIIYFLNLKVNDRIIAQWFTALGNLDFAYSDPLSYIKFLTHILGHANLDHLIANSVYIILLGPLLEEKYSSKAILILTIIVGLISGIINAFFVPSYLLGASGVVYLYIFLATFTNVEKGEVPITAIILIAFFIYKDAYLRDPSDISIATHIIGAVIGILYGVAISLLNIKEDIMEKKEIASAKTIIQ